MQNHFWKSEKRYKTRFLKSEYFCIFSYPFLSSGGSMPYRWSDLQSRPIEYKDFQSATTMYCAKMAHVAIKSKPFHHAFGGFVLFFLCRVPDGTPYRLTCCYHGTARTLSSCTVLCKVSSLSGRWLIDRLITAL